MRNWRQVQLGQIADVRVSNVDKKTLPGEIPVRLCNYMDVYSNDYIRDHLSFMPASATNAEIARFKVECGDVLITKDSETPDDIGIPTVVINTIDNLVCGYHVALLKPNKSVVDPVYLCKQLGRAESAGYFARYAAGSTRYGLPMGAMMRAPIALAPLAQQKKIAAVLSTIDTAIEQTEALIGKYQHIKTGLMHDLFTRGVLPTGQLRPLREQAPELYQETAIGWIPTEWRLRPLGEMANIVSGVTLGAKRGPTDSIDAPYLRVANVQDGYLDLSEIKRVRISPITLEQLRLEPGDVLMNEGGDFDKLGRGAVWQGEIENCIHQNHVFRVRCNPNTLLPDYLSYYSESAFGKKYFVMSSKQSTNLASINSTQLKAYPIALPPLTEQAAITLHVQLAKHRQDTLKAEALKLRSKKLGLMQDLLTGKVPVTVDEAQEEVMA